jgi:hypothetical protein
MLPADPESEYSIPPYTLFFLPSHGSFGYRKINELPFRAFLDRPK